MINDDMKFHVERFAEGVIKRDEAKTAAKANMYSEEYTLKSFKYLIDNYGDAGREALCQLLTHEHAPVRGMAASFLIRYKTDEATQVLQELAKGRGITAFAAECLLKGWAAGDWSLDLIDDDKIINALVSDFSTLSSFYISKESARERKKHLRQLDQIFQELVTKYGDSGREAIKAIADPAFVDSKPKDPDSQPRYWPYLKNKYRCIAAGYLLRYDHEASMRVLQELSTIDDPYQEPVKLAAIEFIESWENGTWNRDPA